MEVLLAGAQGWEAGLSSLSYDGQRSGRVHSTCSTFFFFFFFNNDDPQHS